MLIIWPFLALIVAIKDYKMPWAKNVVWLFTIFYAFTFVISNDQVDANRYKADFEEMAVTPMSYDNFVGLLYSDETRYVDILQPLLTFLVSRITDNYKVLFAVFGLIFGFFYSRNIWFLIERAGPKIKQLNIPIIITFAMIVSIWQINGFRFWTATHIFLYGSLLYLVDGRKRGIWFCVLSVFVHFSFIYPLLILPAYIIAGNRLWLYFVFFISTFFVSGLNLQTIVTSGVTDVPSVFAQRAERYNLDEYKDNKTAKSKKRVWYASLYGMSLRWAVIIFTILIFIVGRDYISKNQSFLRFFSFTLLILGLANLASAVPSGARFYSVASLFAMASVFWYVQSNSHKAIIKFIIPVLLPLLLLFNIVNLRLGFDSIGVFTIFGNPLFAPFIDNDSALIDIIR